MNKFEGITVLHIESSDYIGEALNPAVEREVDAADIVIVGGKTIKNRVNHKAAEPTKQAMKTFKGLTLEPETAFHQIAVMIEAGLIISVTDGEDHSDLGDCIFILAKKYAEAAHANEMENRK